MNIVFKNAIAQFFTYGIRAISDFVIVVLIGRLAGISNLGIYSFAITFSLAARFMLDLGFGMYLVREIAKNKNNVNKYIGNTIVVLLFVSPVLILLIYAFLHTTILDSIKINAVILCVLGMIFMAISSTLQTAFHAFQKMQYQTLVIFIQEFSFLLGSFVVLFFKFDFIIIFFIYLFSRLLSMICAFIVYNYKIVVFNFNFDNKFIPVLLKEVSPFVIQLIFTTIYARSAIIFISYLLDDLSVGLFEVGMAFTLKGIIISQIISKSLFPKLSQLHKESNLIEFDNLCKKLLNITNVISIPICVILFIYSSEIVGLFFSDLEFSKSIILIKIMSIALFFKLFALPIADILTTSNKQELRTIIVSMGAFVNLCSLYFLIPYMGIKGAAFSMLITEFFMFVLMILFSSKIIRFYSIKSLLIGFVNILIPISFLVLINVRSLFALLGFLLFYFAMLLATKTIEKDFFKKMITDTKYI